MTSVCLLIVLLFSEQVEMLFSEQGETMQCAVWKDDHEQTETTFSVFQEKKFFYFFF